MLSVRLAGLGLVLGTAVLGCDQVGREGEPLGFTQQPQDVTCAQECPAGSRLATFATEEQTVAYDTFKGAYVYGKQGCETYCEPEIACVAPNVPVVTGDHFECQLLPLYDSFPKAEDVDLSFGSLWDEAQVQP
jgi:hypothetical protein